MAEEHEFRHIVRIAATEVKGERPLLMALRTIKGVNFAFANAVIKALGYDPKKKIGEFNDEELEKIEDALKNPQKYGIPTWMLNRRKDLFTGKDMHLVSHDLDFVTQQTIDHLTKIKSYRGIRHALGLRVRGQRTRSTGRRGKTVGVSKKRR